MDFSPLNVDRWRELHRAGQHAPLTDEWLAHLARFEEGALVSLSAEDQAWIDQFVQAFLDLVCQPDYVVADRHVIPLIELNMTISNLVAISRFRTTDAWLERLAIQPNNFVKYLALCSARNRALVDRLGLFATHGPLACQWYNGYLELYRASLASPVVWENLRQHLQFDHPALTEFSPMYFHEAYFGSTYIDPTRDRAIREKINHWTRKRYGGQLTVRAAPDPRKIAIVTAFWRRTHSAYRIVSQLVEALRPDYDLTLVQLGKESCDDASLFERTGHVGISRAGLFDHEWLADTRFRLAFFLDVGMSPHSVVLSNLRLAPIQVCGLGQSVSSFGARIDYFISGAAVELTDRAAGNYSERLVLLPGMGAVHNRPRYEPKGLARQDDAILVNCPWTIQKINYPLLRALQKILRHASRPMRFRFYPGSPSARCNEFLPMTRDLAAVLGAGAAEVVTPVAYDEYMRLMEQGDLCLDSFPFGGCNVVVDSLFLRQPTVALEGVHWYNRIGPHLLRRVGLDELVARDEPQYVEKALRLIHDDAYRLACRARLEQADLDSAIFTAADAPAFRRAVDFLIANHERLQQDRDRSPIHVA